MIDIERFNKRVIIKWEDRTKDMRIWSNTTKHFLKLVASKERYARLVGGTAKKALFKSKSRTDNPNNMAISVLP